MIKDKYRKQIVDIVQRYTRDKEVQVFLFGSSVRKNRFGDCDIGLMGNVSEDEIHRMREQLVHSTIPYKVDVINFNSVSNSFRQNVLQGPLLWIKP